MATSNKQSAKVRPTPKGTPVTTPEQTGDKPANEETSTTDTAADAGQSAQAPGESAATIVGDASAPAGTPVEAVVQAAETFTSAVESANTDAVLRELKLVCYAPEFQDRLLALLSDESDLTPGSKHIIKEVLAYAYDMGPTAPMDAVSGGRYQIDFINNLLGYLNSNPSDLRVGFSVCLAVISESMAAGTGFSGVLPFRWLESINASAERRKALTALMHLLTSTADVKVRMQAIKQIDLAKALSNGLTDSAAQAVTQFYMA